MHPLAYQCNLVLGTSHSVLAPASHQEKLITGKRAGLITFLNTFALGIGSLEMIQFMVNQPSDAMFSNHRVQGVESAQLILTLAGSICGLWL